VGGDFISTFKGMEKDEKRVATPTHEKTINQEPMGGSCTPAHKKCRSAPEKT